MDEALQAKQEEFGLHLLEPGDVDAVQMLIEEHGNIKQNFETLEESGLSGTLLSDTLHLLLMHSRLEEEIVYPPLSNLEPELISEAAEEHKLIEYMIADIQRLMGKHGKSKTESRHDQRQLLAKVKVLREMVINHIKMEEQELLPELKAQSKIDLKRIAREMVQLKIELKDRLAHDDKRADLRQGTTRGAGSAGKSLRKESAKKGKNAARNKKQAKTSLSKKSKTKKARAQAMPSRKTNVDKRAGARRQFDKDLFDNDKSTAAGLEVYSQGEAGGSAVISDNPRSA